MNARKRFDHGFGGHFPLASKNGDRGTHGISCLVNRFPFNGFNEHRCRRKRNRATVAIYFCLGDNPSFNPNRHEGLISARRNPTLPSSGWMIDLTPSASRSGVVKNQVLVKVEGGHFKA